MSWNPLLYKNNTNNLKDWRVKSYLWKLSMDPPLSVPPVPISWDWLPNLCPTFCFLQDGSTLTPWSWLCESSHWTENCLEPCSSQLKTHHVSAPWLMAKFPKVSVPFNGIPGSPHAHGACVRSQLNLHWFINVGLGDHWLLHTAQATCGFTWTFLA